MVYQKSLVKHFVQQLSIISVFGKFWWRKKLFITKCVNNIWLNLTDFTHYILYMYILFIVLLCTYLLFVVNYNYGPKNIIIAIGKTLINYLLCSCIWYISVINMTYIFLVFSGVRVTWSLVLYACFVDVVCPFVLFSFGHCVVCSSSIYGFWLPLCYLQTLSVTSV